MEVQLISEKTFAFCHNINAKQNIPAYDTLKKKKGNKPGA